MMSVFDSVVVPVLIGLGLSSCAGLRAWLPLLLLSILVHCGYVEVNDYCSFLERNDTLWVLGVATIAEMVGDKFAIIDHVLDAVGTILRPAAGALLTCSLLVDFDPLIGALLGLVVGGGTAFVVNGGKALGRTWVTAMVPAHGGIGNAILSFIEDVVTVVGAVCAVLTPWGALLCFLVLIVVSLWAVVAFMRQGGRIVSWLWNRARDCQVIEMPLSKA